MSRRIPSIPLLSFIAILVVMSPAVAQGSTPASEDTAVGEQCPVGENGGPCLTDPKQQPVVTGGAGVAPPIPAGAEPRVVDLEKEPWLVESVGLPANHPALRRARMIWAKSFLWTEAPKIEVEEWLKGDAPDMDGKYLLVETWATWCPPCRRSLSLLNYYHEKYGDELVVIAINETDKEALEKMEGPTKLEDVKFHMAIDTQRRFANELGVFGIPHAVIIEPENGCVIWEGMPTLLGHELKGSTIERILEIGRKTKAAAEASDSAE